MPTSTKPKPRGEKLARHLRIFVEARCHAYRIGKIETEDSLRQSLVVGLGGAGIKPKLERLDGEVVCPLGVERKEKSLA